MRKTAEIEAGEAERNLSDLLSRVERGEEIIITRGGEALARLVPAAREADRAHAQAAVARIRARRKVMKLGEFDWAVWKADRNGGRP